MATEDHSRDLAAASAAIGAAIRIAGPTMDSGDLLGAIVALVVTQPGYATEATHALATRLICEAVNLVDAKGAREILERVAIKRAERRGLPS